MTFTFLSNRCLLFWQLPTYVVEGRRWFRNATVVITSAEINPCECFYRNGRIENRAFLSMLRESITFEIGESFVRCFLGNFSDNGH